jgi:hypothetical protein
MHSTIELESPHNHNAIRWEWIARTTAGIVAALLLLAGLLGFFDRSGPLSKAVRTAGPLAVEYTKYGQYETPDTIRVVIKNDYVSESVLRFDRNFNSYIKVEDITPPPLRVASDDQGYSYFFQTGRGENQIIFRIKPETTGNLIYKIGLNNTDPLVLESFIYP